MTTWPFNFNRVDASWKNCLQHALTKMDPTYLEKLCHNPDWLPGPDKIFSAFSLPVNKVNYVLFGESPYPRLQSANGYAFWDAAVTDIWSPTGLSKPVNRATSLRNIIKMLLIADGLLDKHTTQAAITNINKQNLIATNDELFNNLTHQGFLLLNATPVLQAGPPLKDARAWRPYLKEVLDHLLKHRPQVKFILLGKIANEVNSLLPDIPIDKLYAEHPYNLSFVTNQKVIDFFRPFHLLRRHR